MNDSIIEFTEVAFIDYWNLILCIFLSFDLLNLEVESISCKKALK